jgi:hypothetical protein
MIQESYGLLISLGAIATNVLGAETLGDPATRTLVASHVEP